MTKIQYRNKSISITEAKKQQAEGYHGVAFVNAGDKIAYINGMPCKPRRGLSFYTENLLAEDCSEYEITFEAGATIQNVIMTYREVTLCEE